jgi:tetratricopeptide (TPR) repeat protein
MVAPADTAKTIFLKALELASTPERHAYLDTACGTDTALRREVESLLDYHEQLGSFLDLQSVPAWVVAEPDAADGGTAVRHGATGPEELSGPATLAGPTAFPEEDPALSFLSPSPNPDALGRLGHYDVLGIVGRGGMGVVLRAADDKLHRVVAIKVMALELAASATARKRFVREAQAAAAVCHEHVITIHAVEEDHSPPYLVMQYVEGMSLQDRLDRTGPLELREILRIGMQAACGLAAAHAQGLVHRDIKPANILLENGIERVTITDFGLARAVDDASLTQSGVVAGTPMYMSPEQADGLPIDQRSDLFSLGSVLYALCVGHAPFRADTTRAVLRRVCEDTPRPIRELNPDIPDGLCALIARLQAKDPNDRFASAAEVAEMLGQQLAQVQQPSRVGHVARIPETITVRKRAPRRQRWAMAAAILLMLLAGFGLSDAAGVTHLAGTVIRWFHLEGTLMVEVDDPGVSVTIDGEELVITGAGSKEIRLKPGQYQVQASKDGKVVQQELVTVTNKGRQVVKVSREAAARPVDSTKGAAKVPSVADPREQLARNQVQLSQMLRDINRLKEAEAPLRAALVTFQQLVTKYPTVAGYRQDLASTYISLGDQVRDTGWLGEAVVAYRAGLAILKKLDAEVPTPLNRDSLARCYQGLADLLKRMGRLQEAEAEMRAELAVRRQWAIDYPTYSNRDRVAECYSTLGDLLRRMEQQVASEEAFIAAIAIRRQLAIDFPTLIGSGQTSTWCIYYAFYLCNDTNPKLRDPKLGLAYAKRAAARVSKEAGAWSVLGYAYYRNGGFQEAVTAINKSTGLLIGQPRPQNFFYLAMAYWQLGDKEQARAWYDKGIQHIEKHGSRDLGLHPPYRDEVVPRLRAEAAELLGIKVPTPPKSKD